MSRDVPPGDGNRSSGDNGGDRRPIDRRKFVQRTGELLLASGLVSPLVACGSSPAAATAPTAPGTPDPAHSTITTSGNTVASGSTVTVTLAIKDANNTQVSAAAGLTVVPSKSGGSATGTLSSVTDHNDGTYTWTYTGILAGTPQTLGATISGVGVTTTLPTCAVTAGPLDRTACSVYLSSPSEPAGGNQAVVTLQAKDTAGNSLTAGGAAVAFSHTGGTSVISIGAVTDHANGTYTAPITPTTAGTATTMSATIGGQAVTSTMPTFTVTVVATVLFACDWSTASGSGASAYTDGGKWTGIIHPEDFNVIARTADPGGGNWPSNMTNILDMKVTAAGHSNELSIASAFSGPGTGQSLYYRCYIRNAQPQDLGSNSNHFIEPQAGNCAYEGEWIIRSYANGTWDVRYHENNGYWDMLGGKLNQATVYRLEWQTAKIAGTDLWNLHIRIYDDTGTLVKGDADFQANYGVSALLSALPTITLTESCEAGNFQIGANGDTPSVDLHVYWGGIMVRADNWCGAY